MSVIIYGVDENSKEFHSLAVSGEKTFYALWQPAIEKLNLKYIGDQRWLYKKDLPMIVAEFQKMLAYANNNDLGTIAFHCETIIAELETNWNNTAPNAERLWMG